MDPVTRQQLRRLELSSQAPLLICDVDEVLVRFIDSLADWLAAQGLRLHADSWALEGNIRRADGTAVRGREFLALLERFFAERTHAMPLLDGAAETLHHLTRHGAQVVLLSNIPHAHYDARRRNLLGHGLDFPLVTNSGPKGPAVRALASMVHGPVAFMDDHPDFLHSAHALLPGRVRLVHFVPDSPFTPHLPPLTAPHVAVRNWAEAGAVLERLLLFAPARQHSTSEGKT